MACYKVIQIRQGERSFLYENGKQVTFSSREDAQAAAQKASLEDSGILPDYYNDNGKVSIKKLRNFFLNDYMHTLAYNNLVYGDVSIGHKDVTDVVKRNGNIPSDGPSAGWTTTRTAVIESAKAVVVDKNGRSISVDNQDAQTYANPMWYLNKYLSNMSKLDERVTEIYYNYILPGYPIPKRELEYLKSVNADMTQRKMVVRNHDTLIKTSFYILSREDTSYLKKGVNKDVIPNLYRQLNQAASLEDKREIAKRIHNFYLPIKGKEYLHNMLNSQELNDLGFMFVDSAGKLARINTGRYENGKFLIQPYEVSDYFIRENVKTDNKPKDVTDSSQTQGLIFRGHDKSAKLKISFNNSDVETTIEDIIANYFRLQGERGAIVTDKTINSLIDNFNVDWGKIVNKILAQSHKAQVTDNIARLIQLKEEGGKPRVSLSNNLISKDLESALMTGLTKSLKVRVAGKAYTLVSSHGRQIIEKKGDIINQKQYLRNPDKYKDATTRGLKFGQFSDKKGVYYAEAIVSQDIIDKYGIDLSKETDNTFGLGVRIPTEGAHSMVVIKVVDVLPSTHSSSIVLPPEVILYSGADFDIDKLFVQHYHLTKNKKRFGSYLNEDNEVDRLSAAYEEYKQSKGQLDFEDFSDTYGKQIEDNKKAAKLNIKPITQEEASNLILDIKMSLAYNKTNEDQVTYPNSFEVWKNIVIKTLSNEKVFGRAIINDDSGKILGISSIVDKVLAQNSNDVGGNNIGIAATFNIMYSLLNHYNVGGINLFNTKEDFFSKAEINLGDTSLDSTGLTKNGNIRVTALIATIIAMMTDNAKEQLAAKLNLSKRNLSSYMYGIGLGISPIDMTVINSKPVKVAASNIEVDPNIIKLSLVGEIKEATSLVQTDFGPEVAKAFSSVTSATDVVNLLKSKNEADNTAGLIHVKTYDKFAKNLNNVLMPLNTLRSLVKGVETSLDSIDDIKSAMDSLQIQFKQSKKETNSDVYKRYGVFRSGRALVAYYRPVLGSKNIMAFELSSNGIFGNIITSNEDMAQKLATALVYNEVVNKNTYLASSSPFESLGLNAQQRLKFTSYLSSRLYHKLRNDFIESNDTDIADNNRIIRDLYESFDVIYTDKGEQSILQQLHNKLLMPGSPYRTNQLIKAIFFNRSQGIKDKDMVTVNVNTVSEISANTKDILADKFNELFNVDIGKTVPTEQGEYRSKTLAELYSTPIDELTFNEAAYMFAMKLEKYSFMVNNHMFRRNSISTILSDDRLEVYYNKLNLIEDLFFKYNYDWNGFAKEFKELMGVSYESFVYDFYVQEYLKDPNMVGKSYEGYDDIYIRDKQINQVKNVVNNDGTESVVNFVTTSLVEYKPKTKGGEYKPETKKDIKLNPYFDIEDGIPAHPVLTEGNKKYGLLVGVENDNGTYVMNLSTGRIYRTSEGVTVEVDSMPAYGKKLYYRKINTPTLDSRVFTSYSYKELLKKLSSVMTLRDASFQQEPTQEGTQLEQQTALETAQQPSVEISSEAKGLAAALTNPTELAISKGNLTQSYPIEYNGETYRDVEKAYQSLKDRSESKTKPSKQNSNNYKLMVELITAKLEQHPRLVTEITKKGGVSWLSAATHQPTKKNTVWETGGQNWFIEALTDAYKNVQKTEQPTTQPIVKSVKAYRTTGTFSSKVDYAQRGSGAYYALDKPFQELGTSGSVEQVEITYDTSKTLDATTNVGQAIFMSIKLSAQVGKKFASTKELNDAVTNAMLNKGYTSLIGWIEETNKEAGRELVIYSTPPTTQQPTIQPQDGTKKRRRSRMPGGPDTTGQVEQSMLNPLEKLNSLLVRFQVGGFIPTSKSAELFNEIDEYNKMLGFDALIAYEESGAMKITSNVYAEQRAKTGINTAFEILDKLSAKFNIPYVIDETIEGKGKFMNGKVYINPKEMTDDTAYHEFAHPFIAAIKRLNRPLYNRLIAEIKSEGGILDKTKKLYTQFFKSRGLRGAQLQAAIVEEAIVQAIGEYAADAKKVFDKSPTLFGAIKEFLLYIKQTIMNMFNKGTVNVENIPTDTSLKELAIILASDLKITNETRLSREVVEILNQIDRCL
jgi:hypothetical protein